MRTFTKLFATTLMLSTIASPVQATNSTFTDMNLAASWAQSAIEKAQELGLMSGDPNGDFRPLDTITRQEVAAIVANLLQLDTQNISATTYADVQTTDWGFKQIEAVKNAGVMVGADNQFRPNDKITREELAVILVKAKGFNATDKGATLTYADQNSISTWAKDFVAAAAELRLMTGDGTNFEPTQTAMRQELAVVAVNFAGESVVNTYTIDKINAGSVSIGDVSYLASDAVKNLFADRNSEILKSAKVRFDVQDNKIARVTYLEITASGKASAADQPEFTRNLMLDGGKSVIDGSLKVSGNYISLKNVSVNGDLEIGEELENDFYSNNLVVKGETFVNGGDPHTVVFDNSNLGAVTINKPNVRVEPRGHTTVGNMTVNSDATLVADSSVTIPQLTVGQEASNVNLNGKVTSLKVTSTQSLTLGGTGNISSLSVDGPGSLTLNGTGSIGTVSVTDATAFLTLRNGMNIGSISLPLDTTPSDIIKDYDSVKAHLPNIKIGDETFPTPLTTLASSQNSTPALDPFFIHPVNYFAGADEVQVATSKPGTVVKVYDAARGGKPIASAVSNEFGRTAKKFTAFFPVGLARLVLPDGFGSLSTLYVTETVPGKRESSRVVTSIPELPTPPDPSDITITNYSTGDDLIEVRNVPAGADVIVYRDSTVRNETIGWGYTKEDPEDNTVSISVGRGFGEDVNEVYVAILMNGSESERTLLEVPPPTAPYDLAQDVQFTDLDESKGEVSGDIRWSAAYSEDDIQLYVAYFLDQEGQKLGNAIGIVNQGDDYSISLATDTALPKGATQIGIFSLNAVGESATSSNVEIQDMGTQADVATEQELRDALADVDLQTITLADDITVTDPLSIERQVTLEGNHHALHLPTQLTLAETAAAAQIRNIQLDKGLYINANDVIVDSAEINASEFYKGDYVGVLIGGSDAGGAKGVVIRNTAITGDQDSIGITHLVTYYDVEFTVDGCSFNGGGIGIYSESAAVTATGNHFRNLHHAIFLNEGARIGEVGLVNNTIVEPRDLSNGVPGDGITLPSTIPDEVALQVVLNNRFDLMGTSNQVVRVDGTVIRVSTSE